MMKLLAASISLALLTACISSEKHERHRELDGFAAEIARYEAADIDAEVSVRMHSGDLRFKGWMESISDDTVFLPGISKEEGVRLAAMSLPDAEVLYFGDVFPYVADLAAYEKRNDALFDYMRRFNRALFQKLVGAVK